MNDICSERHKSVDRDLKLHEVWLNEHDQKIDRLDRSDAANTQAIENLTRSISAQTKAIWGLITIMATGFVGFFFYVVEKGALK